jgi:hypothetical protein
MKKREPIDINELIELLHVPVVENRVHLKIEEIKSGGYENKIELYNQKVTTYKHVLFENRRQEPGKEEVNSCQLYWFELTRFKNGVWKVTCLDPAPPPFSDMAEIVPDDIVRVIDHSLTNPDKVEIKRKIVSNIFCKHYDLEFVRSSENHAFGTIRKTPAAAEKGYPDKTFYESEKQDKAIKLLFSYMQRSPSIRDYFLKEFFNKIKVICEEEGFILS